MNPTPQKSWLEVVFITQTLHEWGKYQYATIPHMDGLGVGLGAQIHLEGIVR